MRIGNIGGIQGGRRPVTRECPKPTVIHCSSGGNQQMLYADELAVVVDSEADLQEMLVEWKEIYDKHGLRVSLQKTEVLWVGQQKKYLDKTGWEETEPKRQLCISWWSGLRGRRHVDGNSQENTSWGEYVEESGRGDGS